jgi:hypothetical protein
MNTNEKMEAILSLRHEVPNLTLTIETGIAPVVLRLSNVYVGNEGYMLSVAGCGETMDEAIDNLAYRLMETDDYVIEDNSFYNEPRLLRFIDGSWKVVRNGF